MDGQTANPGQTRILRREHPCPRCGYDLRAALPDPAGTVRCPECGTATRKSDLIASHIPWAHRKRRGRVWSYLATVWMLLRHPTALPREAVARHKRRDALNFHRVSVLFATLVGTGVLVPALVLMNKAEPTSPPNQFDWTLPSYVLEDSRWGILPLAVGLWLGMRLVLAGYRWIATLRAGEDFQKQRAARLSLYASGLAVVESALLASAYAAAMVADLIGAHYPRAQAWQPALNLFAAGAAILGLALLLAASLAFVIKLGRWKVLRGMIMVLAPPVAIVVLFLTTAAVSWFAGYLAIAIRSALR